MLPIVARVSALVREQTRTVECVVVMNEAGDRLDAGE